MAFRADEYYCAILASRKCQAGGSGFEAESAGIVTPMPAPKSPQRLKPRSGIQSGTLKPALPGFVILSCCVDLICFTSYFACRKRRQDFVMLVGVGVLVALTIFPSVLMIKVYRDANFTSPMLVSEP